MKQPLHVVGIAVSALACLLLVIGLGTTGWLVFKAGNRKVVTVGLFIVCADRCESYDPSTAEAAVRFFVVIGFLLCATAAVLAIVYYVKFAMKDQPNRTVPFVSALELFGAGACTILGCIIFAAKVKKDRDDYYVFLKDPTIGFSFGLSIVGALLCFAAGALIIVQRSRS